MSNGILLANPVELTDEALDFVTGGAANGQAVAETNHDMGASGASGNENASAGPGYMFRNGQVTSDQVHQVLFS